MINVFRSLCNISQSLQFSEENRVQEVAWYSFWKSMFPSLKVTDCQSSNLSQAWTAFEVKAVLSWKVGIMPFTLGVRFPFHLICYLAKEAFAGPACPCTYLGFQSLPLGGCVTNSHSTQTHVSAPLCPVRSAQEGSMEVGVGGRDVVYCFLSLKNFCPLFFLRYLRRLVI